MAPPARPSGPSPSWPVVSWSRRLRRAVVRRRRLLAAVAAGASVAVALQTLAPAPPPTRAVLTAARDLPGGTVLTESDLALAAYPPDLVPNSAHATERALVGRVTAGPVRAGEPVTDVRLVGGGLLEGHPGLVAAPVRIADAGAVSLLRTGDRVDVLVADPQGSREAQVVARAARVLALPRSTDTALTSGGLVVLAVDHDTAGALAAAAVTGYLSLVLGQ